MEIDRPVLKGGEAKLRTRALKLTRARFKSSAPPQTYLVELKLENFKERASLLSPNLCGRGFQGQQM